jgi:isoquinoline 1-oxidoreductase alpha subunit
MTHTPTINGASATVDVDDDTPLLWVLRDVLGMTGTKFGCGMALCGACTVHVDGVATRSYVLPINALRDKSIETIEALGTTPVGLRFGRRSSFRGVNDAARP